METIKFGEVSNATQWPETGIGKFFQCLTFVKKICFAQKHRGGGGLLAFVRGSPRRSGPKDPRRGRGEGGAMERGGG